MTKTIDLPIRCRCGALRGIARSIGGAHGRRAVCYCRDCQAFGHALGRAAAVLDRHGGTTVLLMSQGRLVLTDGTEHLACLRLSPAGVYRWYAACCNTPVGNTPARHRLPYLSLLECCVDFPADAARRPVQLRVHGRGFHGHATGLVVHEGVPVSALLHTAGQVLRWWLQGDHRLSPFFDARTGEPVAEPRVLGAAERQAVDAATRRPPD